MINQPSYGKMKLREKTFMKHYYIEYVSAVYNQRDPLLLNNFLAFHIWRRIKDLGPELRHFREVRLLTDFA